MTFPLVSIVIPIYNVEKYLRFCIDSVICQTYENIEVLLIDDGSTDSCPEICDEYADSAENITCIHQKNGGLSAARNTGLKTAKGKYIYFLDSDDLIEKDAIRMLVAHAEHYKSDITFFDSSVINEDGRPLDDIRYSRKQSYAQLSDSLKMMNTLFKYDDYFTCVPMLFIKRDCLDGIDFYKGIIYEDVLFTFKLFFANLKAIHLPAKLYIRRIRENSIMQTPVSEKNVRSLIMISRQILDISADSSDLEQSSAISSQLNILYESLINSYVYSSSSVKAKCRQDYLECLDKLEKNGVNKRRGYEKLKSLLQKHNMFKFFSGVYASLKKIQKIKEYRKYISKLNISDNGTNVFIMGTPLHGNLGDHLIALGEEQLLVERLSDLNIVDIPMPIYANCRKKVMRMIGKNDCVLISGGGWLGSLWMHNEIYVRNIVRDFHDNLLIIMPQTVYYEDNDQGKNEMEISRNIYKEHKRLHLCLRDEASYNFSISNDLVGDSNRCFLLPDMALGYKTQEDMTHPLNKNDALVCFRYDREKILSDEDAQAVREYLWSLGLDTTDTTTVYQYGITHRDRQAEVENKIKEYRSAKIVVTDRLHSMVFSAIAGTSCVAFDNKTQKVSGVYRWMKHLSYIKIACNIEEAKMAIKYLLDTICLNECRNRSI
jgi:exopolysaccharide biosynthesis predicted pyruvyltransferase EpsI